MIDLENIWKHTTEHPQWSVFGNAADFAALPGTHQAQVFFLDRTATSYLFSFAGDQAHLVTGGGWDPFAKGNFRSVETCPHLLENEESHALLKKWLYQRGIPFSNWIFILSDDYDHALLTSWKILVKYAPGIFFRGDVMVFDKTLNWCLYYFHENQLFFGKDKRYDPADNERMMQELNERKKKYPQFRHPYL